MKKIIKTLLVVMVLVLALAVFAACEKTDCDHNYVQEFLPGYDATCTTNGLRPGYKCSNCGEVTKEQVVVPAYGHNMAEATCTAPSTCTRGDCTYTEGEALGHDWADATCETPKTCSTCKVTEGEALGHNNVDGVCSACDKVFDFAGGSGTAEDPYIIKTAAHMANISKYYGEYKYFKVADGVETLDMTGAGKISLHGSFDGNGVEFVNLSTALFLYVGYENGSDTIKISNFEATFNSTDGCALVRNIFNAGTTTFENIALHGYIEGQYNMGSFYNYGTANCDGTGANYTVKFVNATSDVTLVCTTGNSIGGMLGHGFEGSTSTLSVYMDESSGYTGTMYTTGTATCYKVMSMCSHATYVLNDVETSRYENTYPSTKLVAAIPTAGEDGYYVTAVEGATTFVVYLNAQVTAYDEEGNKIANKAGMTWTLDKIEMDVTDAKVFDLITSASIVNDKDEDMGYTLSEGVLTIQSGRKDNYCEGTVRLQVNQYDADGNLLAVGTINVYEIKKSAD